MRGGKTQIYSFNKKHLSIIFLIAVLITPTISFADADKIFKENNKAVVVVETYNKEGKPLMQGSGFIVRADGAVVTNYHVISNAKVIKIKVGDKILNVEGLIYSDKENDLVILKAKGEKLQTVRLGDIAKANIGEKVYVISSPEGLENTISDGILSGIREITSDKKVLQITAPISPGSSGGAVFNNSGEVIGIATSIIEKAQNLNFAMPVNLIKDKISSKKLTALKDSEIEEPQIKYLGPLTAEDWFDFGFAYDEAGMYREAAESFKQAIRIKPDYAKAHFGLGSAYGKLGMYKEKIEAYKQAIRIKPDYAEAHHNLGVAYLEAGKWNDAAEAFKQTIRINPEHLRAYYGLGVSYDELGTYKEAIKAHKYAIRINPDYAAAHFDLGIDYGRLGMYKEAIKSFKEVIRIKPNDADAHYNLGLAYGKSDMTKQAIKAFKEAIKIKPDLVDAHYNLVIAYLELNDRDSALNEYKILKKLDSKKANELFNLIYK